MARSRTPWGWVGIGDWRGPDPRRRGWAGNAPNCPAFPAKTCVKVWRDQASAVLSGIDLPGRGRTCPRWLLLVPFQPTPSLEPSLGAQKGSHPRQTRDQPSTHDHRLQGRSATRWDGDKLDPCTHLCAPLYICHIECIYVGNMLASPCVATVRRAPYSTEPFLGRWLSAAPFPMQPPPPWASAHQFVRLSVRVLSSVHALIGLTQPQPGTA